MTDQSRQAPRICPKVRAAIEVRVCKGLSIAAAAEKTGLSRTSFAKALQRPAVADPLSQTQARFVAEVNSKRALHWARALDVALVLLNNDKTDDKVKLIQILLQDGKAPAVSVHVDASTTHHGSYEFVPSNARIVEIMSGTQRQTMRTEAAPKPARPLPPQHCYQMPCQPEHGLYVTGSLRATRPSCISGEAQAGRSSLPHGGRPETGMPVC